MKIILETDKEKEFFQKSVDKINERTGLNYTVNDILNSLGNRTDKRWTFPECVFSFKRICESADWILGAENDLDDLIEKWTLEFAKSIDWFMIILNSGGIPADRDSIERSIMRLYQDKMVKQLQKDIHYAQGYWFEFFDFVDFDDVWPIIKEQCGDSVKHIVEKDDKDYIYLDINGKEFQEWLNKHSTKLT